MKTFVCSLLAAGAANAITLAPTSSSSNERISSKLTLSKKSAEEEMEKPVEKKEK